MVKEYIIDRSYQASKGIAAAVLVCLGIGLLIQTVGQLLDVAWLIKLGSVAKTLFIPALGIGMAMALKATPMVVMSAAASAVIGGGGMVVLANGGIGVSGGEPVGAIVASLVAIWFGRRVAGKTKFDMILTPAICLLSGGIVGLLSSHIITPILGALSSMISLMMQTSPIVSSIAIGVIFALLILSPASSAALAIALQLDPVASAAALIGCSVQFTAFAFLGIKENTSGAFFGQLICTPKLQTPNIIKNPKIMIVPLLLSGLMSPLGVLGFGIVSANEVAGLGLCALVSPLYMASHEGWEMLMCFLLVSVAIPAGISLLIRPLVFRLGWMDKDNIKVELN